MGKNSCETRNDHPGIFIDIFPLDAVPPYQITKQPGGVFEIAKDIWLAASDPRTVLDNIINRHSPVAGIDTMLDILGLPLVDRLTLYENILSGIYDNNENINFFPHQYVMSPYKKSWYSDIIMLPFEFTNVPAPIDYDLVLKTRYGNYIEPVMYASDHEADLIDPDNPYTKYINE